MALNMSRLQRKVLNKTFHFNSQSEPKYAIVTKACEYNPVSNYTRFLNILGL